MAINVHTNSVETTTVDFSRVGTDPKTLTNAVAITRDFGRLPDVEQAAVLEQNGGAPQVAAAAKFTV